MLKKAARKYNRKFVNRNGACRIASISVFIAKNFGSQYRNFIYLKSVSAI